MVWPSRARQSAPKHAFETALDDARLDADGAPMLDDTFATGPSVGSLGDIAVASGYVAAPSLARAYGTDDAGADAATQDAPAPDMRGAMCNRAAQPAVEERRAPPDRPGEAARKLKAALAERKHTAAELTRLRRGFAIANHPDRVDETLRAEAVQAMAEVNAAIDRALAEARRS
ncbi:MAG: hypothetical protein AB7J30_06205 [Hyphomicrobium sp.]|uniref:hypothetical protein n=1 Tax=Hyphomicrobium sp. TaxID=82 RepID=UPI003D0A4324